MCASVRAHKASSIVTKIALATSVTTLRIAWVFNAQSTMATNGAAYSAPRVQQLIQAIGDFGGRPS